MDLENQFEIVDIRLPKLGESIVSATVVQWLKQEGDNVALDEPLLEVATDKVNSEIPSPVAGIVKEICVACDAQVEVGALVARVAARGLVESKKQIAEPVCSKAKSQEKGQELFLSPAVLALARQEGLTEERLRKIEGSGAHGRITKKDVENYVALSRREAIAQVEQINIPIADNVSRLGEERIAMSGMRKMIADNMVRSFYEAPHASLVIEADVTETMKLIKQEKERFLQAHDAKLTITSFILQAMTKAIAQYPMLNASLEQETIVLKRYVNIGIAVNVDKGLIVPVIKNCQERNLVSVAKALHDLSSRARLGKLSPQEVTDGTITLTNFGMAGALIGVPIIRYPEVAIIGVGGVQKRVVVREDDSFAVRHMVYLTLTFDHRVIDGIYGCQFLSSFKHYLETPSVH